MQIFVFFVEPAPVAGKNWGRVRFISFLFLFIFQGKKKKEKPFILHFFSL